MSTTVTNSGVTINPDYPVKVTETADGQVQHVNVDSIADVTLTELDDITEQLDEIAITLRDTLDFNQGLISADEKALRDDNYENIEQMSRAIVGAQGDSVDGISRALKVESQSITFPFSQDRLGNVAYANVSGLSWMSFQVTLVGTSSAVQPQFSNDGQTWVASLFVSSAVVTAPTTTAATAVGLYGCPVIGKYARLAITGTTAGRCAGVVIYRKDSPSAFNITGAVTVASTVVTSNKTNNAAIPAATNLGTLPSVANAVSPVFTETFQTALSVDLAGAQRIARSTDTQPLLLKDKGQPLSLNLNGELRVDNTILRQTAELQLLKAMEENMGRLIESEQASSGDYGFEIR